MKLVFSRHILKNTNFFENPPGGNRGVPCGRTGGNIDGQSWRSWQSLFRILRTHLTTACPTLKKRVIIPINCFYWLAYVMEVVVFSVKKKLNSWISFRRISGLQKGCAISQAVRVPHLTVRPSCIPWPGDQRFVEHKSGIGTGFSLSTWVF